jgi:hypothetical protein
MTFSLRVKGSRDSYTFPIDRTRTTEYCGKEETSSSESTAVPGIMSRTCAGKEVMRSHVCGEALECLQIPDYSPLLGVGHFQRPSGAIS